MKKVIIFLMLGLMIFTVTAADDDYMGQQFLDVPIIETCADDGLQCDSTYGCNITITDPDQEVIILNLPMTRNETFYNFTLVDTDALGIYKIKTYCTNGTFSGESIDGRLEITTTGDTFNTTLLILVLLLGGLILLLLGVYLKNFPIGFLSGLLFSIAGVYIMTRGFGNMADLYTRSIAIIVIALGGYLTIAAGLEWLKDVE